jgi:hypothetical protein
LRRRKDATLKVPLAKMIVGCERNQLRRIFLLKIEVILAPTNIDLDIAPLGPAQLLNSFFERRNSSLTLWVRCSSVHQHADAAHTPTRLSTRSERPCHSQSSNSFNEGASSHCRPQGPGLCGLWFGMGNYSRDLRPAEWGPTAILRGNNPRDRMSALGQKRMAAFPINVRFTPKSGHASARS